jgi:uncharacterized MAPEG superfamily protein
VTIELTMLALSALLGLVQITLGATAKNRQFGREWASGPRDEPVVLSATTGRLERAFANFLETFPIFAAAVLVANAAGVHNWMTLLGVQLYFWGRVVYVPLYAYGVPVLRSIVWSVATIGIVLILLALVF